MAGHAVAARTRARPTPTYQDGQINGSKAKASHTRRVPGEASDEVACGPSTGVKNPVTAKQPRPPTHWRQCQNFFSRLQRARNNTLENAGAAVGDAGGTKEPLRVVIPHASRPWRATAAASRPDGPGPRDSGKLGCKAALMHVSLRHRLPPEETRPNRPNRREQRPAAVGTQTASSPAATQCFTYCARYHVHHTHGVPGW